MLWSIYLSFWVLKYKLQSDKKNTRLPIKSGCLYHQVSYLSKKSHSYEKMKSVKERSSKDISAERSAVHIHSSSYSWADDFCWALSDGWRGTALILSAIILFDQGRKAWNSSEK